MMDYKPPRTCVGLDKFYSSTGLEREKIEEEIRRQNSAWYIETIKRLGTDFIIFGINSGEIYQKGPGKIPNEKEQRRIAGEHNEPVLAWAEVFAW